MQSFFWRIFNFDLQATHFYYAKDNYSFFDQILLESFFLNRFVYFLRYANHIFYDPYPRLRFNKPKWFNKPFKFKVPF